MEKTLNAQKRTEFKKGPVGRLRRSGRIPGVVYGHTDPQPISVDEKDFEHTFKTISESTIISLKLDKKGYDVLVKDYQEDILTGRILHIDFYEVEAGKLLRTHVSVHVHGTPVGAREGGILEVPLHELEIECLPKDIPAEISIEIGDLNIGDSIHVADVTAPEGVKILNNPDQVIALVAAQREEIVEEEEAEVASGEELAEGEEGAAAPGEEEEETEE